MVPLLEDWKKRHDVNKNIDSKQQQTLNNNNNNNNVQPVPKKKSASQRPDSTASTTPTSSDHDVTIVTSQLSSDGAVTNKSPSSAASPNSISGSDVKNIVFICEQATTNDLRIIMFNNNFLIEFIQMLTNSKIFVLTENGFCLYV